MIKVAICDDEATFIAELETVLAKVFSEQQISHKVESFLNGEDLCAALEAGKEFSLLFLDIEFEKSKMNGIEIGRYILEYFKNNTLSIVYVSWEQKYAMELFDIRPMNFLLKPLTYSKISKIITTFLKLTNLGNAEFSYSKNHSTYKVPLRNIIYMENRKRKVVLHLVNGKTDEFYGSLKEIYNEQLLNYDFLFIHGSYVVNYDFISVVKYDEIFITENDTPLPISPNRRNEVREKYLAIIKKRRGM